MCSPSNVSCHTNATRQDKQSPNIDTRRQQSAATGLVTSLQAVPSTRVSVADSSQQGVAGRQVEFSTTDENKKLGQKGMSHLAYSHTRAHSPQYSVNSGQTGILHVKDAPNAFLPKPYPTPFSATSQSQNNMEDFNINNTTSSSSHSAMRSERREQPFTNTLSYASKDATLVRNPKPPSPLMLSSDEMHYRQYEPSLKDTPSPRDVTQDTHLYRKSGVGSPDARSHAYGTYRRSHPMDFHPSPRVSLTQVWPQTSFVPGSPHSGETRQESSPTSSASNSSVASPEEWVSNMDCNNMNRDQPHSSPSILCAQPYMSPPMYRQQQMRPRVPFHLKPRPNNTYRPPQKQFQAQYTPYWNQPTANYRSPTLMSQSNNLTPPHHTRLSHPTQTLSPIIPISATTGLPSPPARTSPEILKTLLRKKACLYEPGTSRAITLLTWIVARSLALQYGYFSRQHLQSGVHSIVAEKITRGIITRTKVNRCMQVILNSCFYYIIPKPDGTEESGESFRCAFRKTVADDTALIKTLPEPWNDLEFNDETVIDRNCVSPVLADMKEEEDDNGRNQNSNKRQVLLCFNENVRCAEDVLRCHNDFIRDSAISANLILTPEEWRCFYLCKDEKNAPLSPMKKGAIDTVYDSYLSFDTPADVEKSLASKENISVTPSGSGGDALGQMTTSELAKFRTTWCCKRYDHDATLCRFAHIDVNKGWLRRNPTQMEYSVAMCPKTSIVHNKASVLDGCYVNACEDGVRCKLAHSQEEVDYHPKSYKANVCESSKKGSNRTCDMRDVCPNLHPGGHSSCISSPPRFKIYHNGRRINDTANRIKGHLIGGKHPTPSIGSTEVGSCVRAGAPMLYLSPAPNSEFDKTLHFPGLFTLYRSNCATYYANDVGSEQIEYSNFGDYRTQAVPLPSVGKPATNDFSLFGAV